MREANELIVEKLRSNDELRRLHLKDAFECLFTDEYRIGLLMLRDVINASCGFPAIAAAVGKDPKSVMRMLSNAGNPTIENLFKIIHFLIEREGGKVNLKFVA